MTQSAMVNDTNGRDGQAQQGLPSAQLPKVPFLVQVAYAMGQLGWALACFAGFNLLTAFYVPPKTGEMSVFPSWFENGSVFFGLTTVLGLIIGVGKLVDALSDPVIARLSDKTKSRLGRRRFFLAISVIPFTISSVLVFVPLVSGQSIWNAWWLGATMILFYLTFTMYQLPFYALLAELGRTAEDRLRLSVFISITWALGSALGSQATLLYTYLMSTYSLEPVRAFQTSVALLSGVALLFMLVPVFFVNEKKYCAPIEPTESFFGALKSVFGNPSFRIFAVSDLAYWLGLTFVTTGLVFYIPDLLGLPSDTYATVFPILIGASFLFYAPIFFLARKFGKKSLMILAYVLFASVFAYIALLGLLPLAPWTQLWILVGLSAIPLSIFATLQNAIISDISTSHMAVSKRADSAIFFSSRSFAQKIGVAAAGALFPTFLKFGSSDAGVETQYRLFGWVFEGQQAYEMGLRSSAMVACAALLLGLVVFLRYNERSILQVIENQESQKPT